jgi:MFS family permease
MSDGYSATSASAVVSVASWVMIFSGAACGQIADRTGKRDQILYACLAVAMGVLLMMLQHTNGAVVLSLLFGLVGAAPAGVIMALTGEAMAPQRRAFGMGVFFTVYFIAVSVAPAVAGWLFDRTANPQEPIVFAACLFAATAVLNATFRMAKRSAGSG